MLQPEASYVVTVTPESVTCRHPGGQVESVDWDDLQTVVLETNDHGPLQADVLWILFGQHGGCVVPQGATGEQALMDRLFALEGFDLQIFLEGMKSTQNQHFVCWSKTRPPARPAQPGSFASPARPAKPWFSTWPASVIAAIRRARLSILTIAATYFLSVVAGVLMVHAGNLFALDYRDRLVGQAAQKDPAALAAGQGDNLRAALWDFAGNLGLGAVPKTIAGFSVIFPYPFVAYQGWVGGIVSVRGDHTSRLNDARSAVYYLLTLILQLIPYSLAIGAGVNVGLAAFRPSPHYQGAKWLGLYPKQALWDMALIYSLVVPLFLVASLWEFLSPWNI